MTSLISVINQGLIFSLVAIAVYLTSRVIKRDDLSVEGSFGLGGAITAVMLERAELVMPAVVMAMIAGALVGLCTGILFTRLKMNHLMAGLVTTTGCFSIALALASSNKIVEEQHTMFSWLSSSPFSEAFMLTIVTGVVLLAVWLLMRSELGLLMRSVGENPSLLAHLGKSANHYYCASFMAANAITALAGALFVQWSGFFSITGNVGILVTGLASLMIAELMNKRVLLTITVAAILYQSIFMVTLTLGIDPILNNLIKAMVMIAIVIAARATTSRKQHHA